MEDSKMILAYRASSQNEAAMLAQALEAAGIETLRAGGQSSIGFGELPPDALLVDLYIPKDKAVLARTTIEGIQSKERQNQPEWSCATCGEGNEGGFELCWSCQAAKV